MLVDPAINQILDRDKAGRQSDFYQVVFSTQASEGHQVGFRGSMQGGSTTKNSDKINPAFEGNKFFIYIFLI